MNHQIQYLQQKHGKNFNNLLENGEWLGDGHDLYEAFCYEQKMLSRQTVARLSVVPATRAPRRTRQRGQASRSSSASGDSNDADPEPERALLSLNLYDQAALASFLCISKKSVQNTYSKTPWLLPQAISIPGARGPRWTPESVQEWLQNRPQHTSKPIPQPAKKKVGRPRIAVLRSNGGAA